jgi:hypothetical protein
MRCGLPECHEGKPIVDVDVSADESATGRDEGRFRRCQRLSKVRLSNESD